MGDEAVSGDRPKGSEKNVHALSENREVFCGRGRRNGGVGCEVANAEKQGQLGFWVNSGFWALRLRQRGEEARGESEKN